MKYNFFNFLFTGKKRWFSVALFAICSFFYVMLFATNTWDDFLQSGWIVFLMITFPLTSYVIGSYIDFKKGKKEHGL